MFSRAQILIAVLLICAGARASEVLRVGKDMTNIAVTHDPTRQWMPKDRVCILQRAREVVCGVVVKSTAKGAIVRLDTANYDVMAGDKVMGKFQPTPAEPPSSGGGTALLNSVGSSSESDAHLFNVAGGVNVGTSFFYPVLSFAMAVAPNWSIGLSGMFLTASSDPVYLTAFGGYATVNYYSQEYFRGLWIQAGAGMTFFSVSDGVTDESAASFTGLVTAGWRGYWDLGLNIGVGAGLQYISTPDLFLISPNAAGVRPMIVVDLGFNF